MKVSVAKYNLKISFCFLRFVITSCETLGDILVSASVLVKHHNMMAK